MCCVCGVQVLGLVAELQQRLQVLAAAAAHRQLAAAAWPPVPSLPHPREGATLGGGSMASLAAPLQGRHGAEREGCDWSCDELLLRLRDAVAESARSIRCMHPPCMHPLSRAGGCLGARRV